MVRHTRKQLLQELETLLPERLEEYSCSIDDIHDEGTFMLVRISFSDGVIHRNFFNILSAYGIKILLFYPSEKKFTFVVRNSKKAVKHLQVWKETQ